MDIIKVENSVCYGCLSKERKLSYLKENSRLYYFLLGQDPKIDAEKMNDLLVCWECMEMLRKIRIFENKIRIAYNTLVNSYYQWEHLKSLSKLAITNKDTYDSEIEHDIITYEMIPSVQEHGIDMKEELDEENPVEDLKETKEEYDIYFDLHGRKQSKTYSLIDIDIPDTVDSPASDDSMHPEKEESMQDKKDSAKIKKVKATKKKTKEEEEEERIQRRIRRSKNQKPQSIKRYEKYATVKRKEEKIDKHQINGYYKRVCITEQEMEEIIEKRDRRDCAFHRMPLRCEVCRLGYKKKKDFVRHNALNHPKYTGAHKCTECKISCSSIEELQRHWKRHLSMLRCIRCGELCRSIGEMVKHVNRAHTVLFTCKECNYPCGTLREFSKHYRDIHERLVCDHCGKGFFKKSMLVGHIKRNHLPAKCEACGRQYSQYHALESHIRTYHPEMIGAEDTEGSYCVECDKQFMSVYKYRRHLYQSARHTPQKKVRVPCPDCGKIFTRRTYMNNHYRLFHVKDTKHYCDLCNKFFATGYAVRKHVEFVHEKKLLPKNKMCDICGRGFSTNRILANHIRTHTGERPFKCAHCPASFGQVTAMHTHVKTQHKNYTQN